MYTLIKKSKTFIVSDSFGLPKYFLSHDEEKDAKPFAPDLLSQYLSDARSIFKSECDILLSTDRAFTEADSERLIVMLKLLIDARKTWQEEEGTGKCCPPIAQNL